MWLRGTRWRARGRRRAPLVSASAHPQLPPQAQRPQGRSQSRPQGRPQQDSLRHWPHRHPRPRLRPYPLLGALLAVVLAAGVRAQDEWGEPVVRHPEAMRGDLPVQLVGREQAENSFRHRAPALQRVDKGDRRVDLTDLRRRKLQMYEGGSFAPMLPTADTAPRLRRRLPAVAPAAATEVGAWESIGWSLVALGVGVLFAMRQLAPRPRR